MSQPITAFLVLSKTKGNSTWAGNDGYHDSAGKFYSFDSKVANGRNLLPGTIIVVRVDDFVAGVGVIHTLDAISDVKTLRKCPICLLQTLEARKSGYKCTRCGDTFTESALLSEQVPVTSYRAHYSGSWSSSKSLIPAQEVETLMESNDRQSAIRKVTPQALLAICARLDVDLPALPGKFSNSLE